ncbi:MAG: Hpt domain-containing protein [Pseudomonadota bacterium]
MFGEEGALAWLLVFRKDLAEHLARIEHGFCETKALQDIAHRTAGRAGLLGFRALADASACLDAALRHNGVVAAARDRWISQARLAVDVLQDVGDGAAQAAPQTTPPPR